MSVPADFHIAASINLKRMPNPTRTQRESREFKAIWNVIKSWDINVPSAYEGYCGATGSHVAAILNALEDA